MLKLRAKILGSIYRVLDLPRIKEQKREIFCRSGDMNNFSPVIADTQFRQAGVSHRGIMGQEKCRVHETGPLSH
jgi:hypothetical protein